MGRIPAGEQNEERNIQKAITKTGEIMRRVQMLFVSRRGLHKAGMYLAATATVGLLALCGRGLSSNARAESGRPEGDVAEARDIYQKVQLAELHQLEEGFHHAGSYGGNIDEMMSLWPEGSSLTSGTTTYNGKDAIRAFFTAAGPFNHNWVGLTKAFVFTADIHGDTAELSFQCDYVDGTVSPAVVKVNSVLSGTVRKIHGEWMFWNMTATPVPL
jgi:hypothetical protein